MIGIAQWLEGLAQDRKILGSSPSHAEWPSRKVKNIIRSDVKLLTCYPRRSSRGLMVRANDLC